jgi:hypothetical protein
MTDNYTDAGEETIDESSGAKQMRQKIKSQEQENADLKARLAMYEQEKLETAVTKIGLDPNAGFGKALKQVYKGDVNDDALLDFAKQEYGYEPTGVAGQDAPQPVQDAVIQSDARARVEALESSSKSVVPKDASEILAKVAESGSTKDSIRAKLNIMEAQKNL